MSDSHITAAASASDAQPPPLPSKVLFFERLPAHWTERDLFLRLLQPLDAPVVKSVFLRKRNALFAGVGVESGDPTPHAAVQALVELTDVAAAARVVAAAPLSYEDDGLQQVAVNFSRNQELHERHDRQHHSHHSHHSGADQRPNRILLVTVQNATVPITAQLVHRVFAAYGDVQKIVVFVKPVGLQTLVQFAAEEDAARAKAALTGFSIFPDCCGLQINFSNLPELIVKENGSRTMDFTNPDLPAATEKDLSASRSGSAVPGVQAVHGDSVTAAATPPGAPGRETVSPVLLVCSLRDSVTCDNIFNLFSCYGNVIRVKKLSNKTDHALVQFMSPVSSQSALIHLRGFMLLGRTMEISFSKYSFISIRPGSADSLLVREYGHMMNRFTGKSATATGSKHVFSPTRILHLSNFEESMTPEELKAHLAGFHGGEHCKLKMFTSPSGHVQALAEFATVDAATNILAQAHNSSVGSKRLKLAFSNRSFH